MADLSEVLQAAWKDREGPVILATVNEDRNPNVIYATCVSMFGTDKLVVADNYFKKTCENILTGSQGSILFMTKEGKAYQVKGSLAYHKTGEIFDDMKQWNPEKHPGHAAVALNVEEAYAGVEKLL